MLDLDDLASQSATFPQALASGEPWLLEMRDLLQARMSVVPAERQATLAAILELIDKEINLIETGQSPHAEAQYPPEGRVGG